MYFKPFWTHVLEKDGKLLGRLVLSFVSLYFQLERRFGYFLVVFVLVFYNIHVLEECILRILCAGVFPMYMLAYS